MRPEAVEAMLPFLADRFANPSGAHKQARDARRAIDEARDELAELLGALPGDLIYTSGGTEADNLAVFGASRAAAREPGRGQPGIVVCSAFEHHAVLDPVEHLGGRVVGVDRSGQVDLDRLADLLGSEAERAAGGEGPTDAKPIFGQGVAGEKGFRRGCGCAGLSGWTGGRCPPGSRRRAVSLTK